MCATTRLGIVLVMLTLVTGCGKESQQVAYKQEAAKQDGRRANDSPAVAEKTAAAEPARTEAPSDADSRWRFSHHDEAASDRGPSSQRRPSSHTRVPGFQPGTLTAGSVDDGTNFDDYLAYLDRAAAQPGHRRLSAFELGRRVLIDVVDADGQPLGDARVVVEAAGRQEPLLDTTTRADGRTMLLTGLDGEPSTAARNPNDDGKLTVRVYPPGLATPTVQKLSVGQSPWRIEIPDARRQLPRQLDLALVIDATGSMGDELEYLKVEIDSIAAAVKRRFPNIDQRFALIVYRDRGDEYVVRKFDFTGSLDEFRRTLSDQSAAGGGDEPEAMHEALAAAGQLSWRDRDTARVMFLVADAPPHDADTPAALAAVGALRAKNIAVFPVAASDTHDAAEYVLRATAFLTRGQYLFLTDDSGIGNPHAEPHVDSYQVDRLDRLMIGMITQQLSGETIPAEQFSQSAPQRTMVAATAKATLAGWSDELRNALNSWPVRIAATGLLVSLLFWADRRRGVCEKR